MTDNVVNLFGLRTEQLGKYREEAESEVILAYAKFSACTPLEPNERWYYAEELLKHAVGQLFSKGEGADNES